MALNIMQYLPFIIPLVLLNLGLQIFALVDIIRKKRTKNLTVLLWIIIIFGANTIGPLLYLIFGRAEDIYED